MTWTELTKNNSNPVLVRGAVTVTRKNMGDFNTRGEVALEIKGDAGAKISRKDVEDYFGTRNDNNFTELTKNNSEWSNT